MDKSENEKKGASVFFNTLAVLWSNAGMVGVLAFDSQKGYACIGGGIVCGLIAIACAIKEKK